jgi:hypothetical protein
MAIPSIEYETVFCYLLFDQQIFVKPQHEIQGIIETTVYPHPLNSMSMVIDRFYGSATKEIGGRCNSKL